MVARGALRQPDGGAAGERRSTCSGPGPRSGRTYDRGSGSSAFISPVSPRVGQDRRLAGSQTPGQIRQSPRSGGTRWVGDPSRAGIVRTGRVAGPNRHWLLFVQFVGAQRRLNAPPHVLPEQQQSWCLTPAHPCQHRQPPHRVGARSRPAPRAAHLAAQPGDNRLSRSRGRNAASKLRNKQQTRPARNLRRRPPKVGQPLPGQTARQASNSPRTQSAGGVRLRPANRCRGRLHNRRVTCHPRNLPVVAAESSASTAIGCCSCSSLVLSGA